MAAELLSAQAVQDYFDAFAALERHEIAALALTLGVILFAVVTAIALLRTRARSVHTLAAKQGRDQYVARGSAIAPARCCFSEPQAVIAWAAGSDDPDIQGDPAIIAHASVPQRILAFGTWARSRPTRTRWTTPWTRCARAARASLTR